jgi:hypothetical protein
VTSRAKASSRTDRARGRRWWRSGRSAVWARLAVVALAFAAALAAAVPAAAQVTASRIDEAARALESASVYVDPDAERALSARAVDRLREAVRRRDAGPLYLAVLPGSAAAEAGGDPDAALREIALSVGEPGTYAAVIGDGFRAGATGGVLPPGEAGALAAEALQAESGNGAAAVLEDFVRRLGEARAGGAEGGGGAPEGGGGFPVLLLLLLGLPLALFAFARRRQRQREQAALEAEFEQVRRVARDDVVALGDDIRALDLDMEMPNADREAKQHYALAVERYTQASEALDRARRPEDLQPVTELLEEGRWAMEAARAEMEGRPAPDRRPPCFFDPRHGPSVADLEWAPPGGQPPRGAGLRRRRRPHPQRSRGSSDCGRPRRGGGDASLHGKGAFCSAGPLGAVERILYTRFGRVCAWLSLAWRAGTPILDTHRVANLAPVTRLRARSARFSVASGAPGRVASDRLSTGVGRPRRPQAASGRRRRRLRSPPSVRRPARRAWQRPRSRAAQ